MNSRNVTFVIGLTAALGRAGWAQEAAPDSPPVPDAPSAAAPVSPAPPAAAPSNPPPVAASDSPPPAATAPTQTGPVPPLPRAMVPPPSPLDAEVKLFGYGLRPPKGYTYTTTSLPDSPGSTVFLWRGPLHQNGIIPTLAVTVMHVSPNEKAVRAKDGHVMSAAEKVLRGVLEGATGDFKNIVTSAVQPGRVGAFPALRIYWKGQSGTSKAPVTMLGMSYAVQDGTNVVLMLGMDSAPDGTQDFPLMDAAVMTLHR